MTTPTTPKALHDRHADLLAQLEAAEREARATGRLVTLPGGTLSELTKLTTQAKAAKRESNHE